MIVKRQIKRKLKEKKKKNINLTKKKKKLSRLFVSLLLMLRNVKPVFDNGKTM